MFVRQGNRGTPEQFGARGLAEAGGKLRPSFIIESYERAVECGVPQR